VCDTAYKSLLYVAKIFVGELLSKGIEVISRVLLFPVFFAKPVD